MSDSEFDQYVDAYYRTHSANEKPRHKMTNPMDDFDTDIDCGMPAAIVVVLWAIAIGCIGATLITVAVIVTMAGVAR